MYLGGLRLLLVRRSETERFRARRGVCPLRQLEPGRVPRTACCGAEGGDRSARLRAAQGRRVLLRVSEHRGREVKNRQDSFLVRPLSTGVVLPRTDQAAEWLTPAALGTVDAYRRPPAGTSWRRPSRTLCTATPADGTPTDGDAGRIGAGPGRHAVAIRSASASSSRTYSFTPSGVFGTAGACRPRPRRGTRLSVPPPLRRLQEERHRRVRRRAPRPVQGVRRQGVAAARRVLGDLCDAAAGPGPPVPAASPRSARPATPGSGRPPRRRPARPRTAPCAVRRARCARPAGAVVVDVLGLRAPDAETWARSMCCGPSSMSSSLSKPRTCRTRAAHSRPGHRRPPRGPAPAPTAARAQFGDDVLRRRASPASVAVTSRPSAGSRRAEVTG